MNNPPNELPENLDLFHYTSAAGLLGINTNKSLWFTHISYLNDSQEFTYAINRIKQFIKERYDEKLFNSISDFIDAIPDIPPVFTFSLTEEKDLLSQWRGYCPNGGYCISFDRQQLNRMIKDNGLHCSRCVYSDVEIANLIIMQIVERDPAIYHSQINDYKIKDSKSMSVLGSTIVKNIFKYAPYIKSYTFKEEKEWRIVNNNFFKPSVDAPSVSLEFREGRNFIIPYQKIKIVGSGEQLNIVDVIVSPTPHERISIAACKELLPTAQITLSRIPYRNW